MAGLLLMKNKLIQWIRQYVNNLMKCQCSDNPGTPNALVLE